MRKSTLILLILVAIVFFLVIAGDLQMHPLVVSAVS